MLAIEDSGPGFGRLPRRSGFGLSAVAREALNHRGRLECGRGSQGTVSKVGHAGPPRVVFPQDRRGIQAGWCPEMAGQPWLRICQRPLAEFAAPVIELGGQLVSQRRSVSRCPLRPSRAVPLRRSLQALKAAVQRLALHE